MFYNHITNVDYLRDQLNINNNSGKTERALWERINERDYRDKDSVICNHITNWKGVNYLMDQLNIKNNSAEREKLDKKSFSVNIAKENNCTIDKARRWNLTLSSHAFLKF